MAHCRMSADLLPSLTSGTLSGVWGCDGSQVRGGGRVGGAPLPRRDGDGLWRADKDRVRVVFAGDVIDQRLALVYVPLRLGIIQSDSLFWYRGPAGATPEQMSPVGNAPGDRPAMAISEWDSENVVSTLAVVPEGAEVEISTGATYGADGRLSRKWTSVAVVDGVALSQVADPILNDFDIRVTIDGSQLTKADIWMGGGHGVDPAEAARAAITGVLPTRGEIADPEFLTNVVARSLGESGLAGMDVALQLPWVGEVNGRSAAVITLQPPGGGVLVFTFHGDATMTRADLRLLLPAAGAGSRPLVWRLRADDSDAVSRDVAVLAPPGAVQTELDCRR